MTLLHHCYNPSTALLQHSYSTATPLLQLCYSPATALLQLLVHSLILNCGRRTARRRFKFCFLRAHPLVIITTRPRHMHPSRTPTYQARAKEPYSSTRGRRGTHRSNPLGRDGWGGALPIPLPIRPPLPIVLCALQEGVVPPYPIQSKDDRSSPQYEGGRPGPKGPGPRAAPALDLRRREVSRKVPTLSIALQRFTVAERRATGMREAHPLRRVCAAGPQQP